MFHSRLSAANKGGPLRSPSIALQVQRNSLTASNNSLLHFLITHGSGNVIEGIKKKYI